MTDPQPNTPSLPATPVAWPTVAIPGQARRARPLRFALRGTARRRARSRPGPGLRGGPGAGRSAGADPAVRRAAARGSLHGRDPVGCGHPPADRVAARAAAGRGRPGQTVRQVAAPGRDHRNRPRSADHGQRLGRGGLPVDHRDPAHPAGRRGRHPLRHPRRSRRRTRRCAACSTRGTSATGPPCGSPDPTTKWRSSPPSPWRPSPASATCPTRSWTGRSSSGCADAGRARRWRSSAPSVTPPPSTPCATGSSPGWPRSTPRRWS